MNIIGFVENSFGISINKFFDKIEMRYIVFI